MPFTLYDATVPQFLQVLPALSGLLDKAEAHARAHGLADSDLTGARLAPDMWPFAKQVKAVCGHSAGAIAGAMAGETVPDFSEPPADLAGLKALVADAIARLKAVTPEAVCALAGKDATFRVGERRIEFVAEDYLTSFALPNFFFHATTAYAILRMKGVEIGKRDFLGALRTKLPA